MFSAAALATAPNPRKANIQNQTIGLKIKDMKSSGPKSSAQVY